VNRPSNLPALLSTSALSLSLSSPHERTRRSSRSLLILIHLKEIHHLLQCVDPPVHVGGVLRQQWIGPRRCDHLEGVHSPRTGSYTNRAVHKVDCSESLWVLEMREVEAEEKNAHCRDKRDKRVDVHYKRRQKKEEGRKTKKSEERKTTKKQAEHERRRKREEERRRRKNNNSAQEHEEVTTRAG
jgi:hypothetical protein